MTDTNSPDLAALRPWDHCGYSVTGEDGEEQPCGRPIAGHRWYQDVGEHEDMLDTACDWHMNEGGNLIAELMHHRDALRAERDAYENGIRALVADEPNFYQSDYDDSERTGYYSEDRIRSLLPTPGDEGRTGE